MSLISLASHSTLPVAGMDYWAAISSSFPIWKIVQGPPQRRTPFESNERLAWAPAVDMGEDVLIATGLEPLGNLLDKSEAKEVPGRR